MSCIGSPSTPRHQPETPSLAKPGAARWVLVATILGSSIEFIDGTVVNIALPSIQSAYRATAAQTEWVVAAYALFLSAVLLLAGALGDRYGQRPVFMLGIASFALSSAWCAFAPSIAQLLAARSIQGIGGACLVANSLAFLSNATPLDLRGKAIGTWSAIVSLMAASGPIVGGWLVQHGSWRQVFLLNIPTAGVALAVTFLKTEECRTDRKSTRLDLMGALLGTLGLGSVTLGLIEWATAPRFGTVTFLLGVATAIAFLRWEAKNPAALLPLSLFRNRVFAGTNLVTLLLYGALSPLFFYLPIKLIQILGFSPERAGASMLPVVLILSMFSRFAGSLSRRVGARKLLVVGPAMIAAGLFLLAASGLSPNYWLRLAPGLILTGLGLALTVSPLTTSVMSSVNSERAGVASGINNSVAQVAALLALALSAPLFQHQFDASLRTQLVAHDIGPAESAQMWRQRARLGAISTSNPDGRAAINDAYAGSFSLVMSLAGILTVLAAAAGAISLRGEHDSQRTPSP
jgi:EmrB/QacA subfamily drug resistance transporter